MRKVFAWFNLWRKYGDIQKWNQPLAMFKKLAHNLRPQVLNRTQNAQVSPADYLDFGCPAFPLVQLMKTGIVTRTQL